MTTDPAIHYIGWAASVLAFEGLVAGVARAQDQGSHRVGRLPVEGG